jgi:chemotaxis protein methyltransferase CheR
MESREFIYVKRQILKLTGVDLGCYKTPQVQRRLKNYLVRAGFPNWPKYFRTVRDDPAEINRLKDYITINVSEFFRNPEKFEYLRASVLPELLQTHARLKVWSAGCSRGHEPYTLAMLLAEATDLHREHRILATDIDRSALAFAKAGGPYTAQEVAGVPPGLLCRYLERGSDSYHVKAALHSRVTFNYHNLTEDPFDEGFDLIVCRNVVIYFTAEVKDKLYRRFSAALRPGGVLFVGGTEIIFRPDQIGLAAIEHSFYKRTNDLTPC